MYGITRRETSLAKCKGDSVGEFRALTSPSPVFPQGEGPQQPVSIRSKGYRKGG